MGIYKLQYPAACGGDPFSRWRTSGNSCARTGSQTGSSPPTATSSITAARRGTNSQTSPGSSCPSDCATGLTGSDQWDLVLERRWDGWQAYCQSKLAQIMMTFDLAEDLAGTGMTV